MSARRWGVAAALCSVAVSVFAATPRTFVASYGSDANACSVTSPCRSFNAALAQTSVGGEVIVLDSAGYGPMTITQSVSIIAPAGVYAGVSVFAGDGITINGAGAKVVLRNLALTGLGGANGITITQASDVLIEACKIASFNGDGLHAQVGARVSVGDTLIRGSGTGALVEDTASARVLANFDAVTIWGGNIGLLLGSGASVSVTRTVFAANSAAGSAINWASFFSNSPIGLTIADSLVADNGGNGLGSSILGGTTAIVNLTRTTFTRNAVGVQIGPCAFCEGVVTATRNLVTQQSGDGMFVQGSSPNGPPKNVIVANDNTFSRSGGAALHMGAPDGIMKTVRGADGLPNNAGEETTPTSGTITVVNPF